MTQAEWLEIGLKNKIIEIKECEEVVFAAAYKQWFLMKLKQIKDQSCDRIEVTYNRYYAGSSLVDKYVSQITEAEIVDFLTCCILQNGKMTLKEFRRCIQIVNNVLVYCKDLNLGGAHLYDWDRIKRYLPINSLDVACKREYAVPMADVRQLMDCVVNHQIYSVKQDACLCLCMNFYLGLRIGELAALTFQDFDFDRGVVKVYKTESKSFERDADGDRAGRLVYRVTDNMKTIYSVREIPLLPEVRFFYDRIKEHHEKMNYVSDYLCFDGNDVVMSASLDTCLRKLCALCNVKYFNSHAIRKTFATLLHYAGTPTRVISDLMGHAEVSTTEHSYILSYGKNYENELNYMSSSLKY